MGMLHDLFETKMAELKEKREDRELQLRSTLQVIDEELREVQASALGTSDSEAKQILDAKISELKSKRQRSEDKISKQVYKVRNLPSFNLDCVSFISSKSREGYDQLQENLLTTISRLPKIMIQDHWQPSVDMLLNDHQSKPFVQFNELLEKSNLEHNDLINMLKALSAIGKIVWSDEPLRKATIFHKLEDLSVFLKAIFTHESEIALSFFAILKGMEKQAIQQQYALGH